MFSNSLCPSFQGGDTISCVSKTIGESCSSRCWQRVAPKVDLREYTLHYIRLRYANKAEPTLTLKPRGDITRNPEQGYQWSPNRTCVRLKKLS